MILFRYYKKAAIYPSVFILIFCISYSAIYYFRSELLSLKTAFLMLILPSFFYSLIMSGISLTIFLNKISGLNKNVIWNLFTWFLLPGIYLALVLNHDIVYRSKFGFGFGNEFIYLLFMTIPFILGLVCTFKEYRQDLTSLS